MTGQRTVCPHGTPTDDRCRACIVAAPLRRLAVVWRKAAGMLAVVVIGAAK